MSFCGNPSYVFVNLKSLVCSVQSLKRFGRLESERSLQTIQQILFPIFPQEAILSNSGIGRDVHSLLLSIQHFLLRNTASPTRQNAPRDGLVEAVVAAGMSEPFELSSLPTRGSCGPARKLVLLSTQSLVLCSM